MDRHIAALTRPTPRATAKYTAQLVAVALMAFMVVATMAVTACSDKQAITAKTFTGKWKSSKLVTPLYLYDNGEWEIKTDSGAVLQYGTWHYQNGQIIWRVKLEKTITVDTNSILFATPEKFQLRERDQSVTSFDKLN